MRREIKIIEEPILKVHITYKHLTVGEVGNILTRLQVALRSIAGLTPHEYDRKISWAQPRFIASSVNTRNSLFIEIAFAISVAALILSAPGGIRYWKPIVNDIFRRFKIGVLAMVRGEIKSTDANIEDEVLQELPPRDRLIIKVTRGEIYLKASPQLLAEFTPKQRRAIENFIWAITGPTTKVDISDEKSEISLEWPEENDNQPKLL